MKKSVYTTALLWSLLSISVCSFAQGMQWKEVAAGVWKVSVGKPEAYNLLTAAGAQPNAEALKKMGTTGFPIAGNSSTVLALIFRLFTNAAESSNCTWIITETKTTAVPTRRCRFTCRPRATAYL
jgi:hypothetical protein